MKIENRLRKYFFLFEYEHFLMLDMAKMKRAQNGRNGINSS